MRPGACEEGIARGFLLDVDGPAALPVAVEAEVRLEGDEDGGGEGDGGGGVELFRRARGHGGDAVQPAQRQRALLADCPSQIGFHRIILRRALTPARSRCTTRGEAGDERSTV